MEILACVVSIATLVGTSIVSIIVSTFATPMVEPVRKWLCYPFEYDSNIEKLRKGLETLQAAREKVEHLMNDAGNNGREIEASVNTWWRQVEEITKKARELLEREEKVTSRCSDSLNLGLRHKLSQEAENTQKVIDELINHEVTKRDQVGRRPASQDMTEVSENYMDFKSRQVKVKQLMEALKDTNINMIGVSGMGGVGKTTLVMEASRQVVGEKLFSEVAAANVGETPDIRRIQGEIADMIHLKLDGETEVGRAGHLAETLRKNTKKTLLVLDNIWKTLDLKKIGIPCKGSKVILISRVREVLDQMGCKPNIHLLPLCQEEAWDLAVKTLGYSVEGSELQGIAEELVNKCDCLPVALGAVFKALKGKSIEEWNEAHQRWKDTLQRLQTSAPGKPIGMELTIYSCMELSYNQLKRPEDKDFFLQCAQMPYPNSQMDLLRNCYGLGLFSGTLEGARNTVCRLIRFLKDSGLLQDCSAVRGCQQRSEHFHMHDVFRDVARSIASTDHNMIVVRDGDPRRQWPVEFVLKGCKALSIDAEDIDKIPTEMEFPELKLVSVIGSHSSLPISDTFFQGMEQLRVLEVRSVELLSIPPSVTLLTNLRTLKLDDCELEDITIIGKLENLAILSLRGNNIQELPKEIGLLIHLQLLDLSYNFNLKVILPDVLLNLEELEELYMRDTEVKWKAEGVNSEKNCVSLIDLNHLSRLVTLEISIDDVSCLPNDLLFPKLERFLISVGDGLYWHEQYGTPCLQLKNISSFQLETTFRYLLNRTKSLLLDNLEGVNCASHIVGREDLQHLKHFKIQNSPKIEHFIDSTMSVIVFPTLETLHLEDMINLEEICCGQLSSKCFDKLKSIDIYECGRLKYFISLSISGGLSQLEELVIRDCSNITTVFVNEGGKIEERQANFPELRNLALENLPKLKSFLSLPNSLATDAEEIILEGKVDCCMQILHEEVMLPKLDELMLDNIGAEDVQQDQFLGNRLSIRLTSGFGNLSYLSVYDLGKFKYLISSSLKFMAQLTSLRIQRCKDLEEILLMEDLEMQEEKIFFPHLKELFLGDLPFLKRFCMGSIKFPSLRELEVVNSPRMKSFMGKSVNSCMDSSEKHIEMSLEDDLHTSMKPFFSKVDAFPNLETLEIRNMVELKIIWPSYFPINSFCNLKIIRIESCESLTSIFQSNMLERFQNLEELCVEDCGSLEQVFDLQGQKVEERHIKSVIQLKKLIICNLPKLRHVWNKNLGGFFSFQNLREMEANNCQSLKSLFPASVARHLTQLENLVITKCGVEEIVAGDETEQPSDQISFPQDSFCKLKMICIESCENLKSIFQSNMLGRFQNLEELRVKDCGSLEQVFDLQGLHVEKRHIETTIQLKELIMHNLPKLRHVWNKNFSGFFSFQNLREVKASNCKSLKRLFPTFVARHLTQLDYLDVTKCGVEEIVAREEMEQPTNQIIFLQVKFLHLVDLPRLNQFLRVVHTSRDEGSIEEVHFLFDKVAFPNLENLKICNVIELKIIWPSHFPVDSFCKLKKMHIESCENLTSIFQSNMLERFQNLQKLCVKDCGSLEQVFDLQGLNVEERHIKTAIQLKKLIMCGLPKLRHVWNNNPGRFFNFQNLRKVEAKNCQSLKSLFPASIARQLMQLENLFITNCGVEEIVAREDTEQPMDQTIFPQVKFLHLVDLPKLKQFLPRVHASRNEGSVEEVHFLFDKVAFPNLENLKICNVIELKIIWPSHFPVDSFCKLKKMHIESCENLTSIVQSNMLERFQNLQKLCVKDCGSLEQVFDPQGLNVEERHIKTVIQLQKLIICGLPKLRHVWNKDPGGFFCFQNLLHVEASNCQSLKSLFPASVARHLTQLEKLAITECGVEEIVAGDEATQTMDQCIFPQVEFLALRDLPTLKRFHPGLHTSEWPMLMSIWVERCPFVCIPKWKEGKLEECQPETCDKQVHFLFDTNQEVDVETWDLEYSDMEDSDMEDSDMEDSEEEEDEGSS